MPNGYSWLDVATWTTHSYDHWVILSGLPTLRGSESEAFREPDDVESRLIDVATSRPRHLDPTSANWIPCLPADMFNELKYSQEHPGEATNTWDHSPSSGVSVDRSAASCVVASTVSQDVAGGGVRWIDAVPALVGVEDRSSVLLVLITSLLSVACAPESSGTVGGDGRLTPRASRRSVYHIQVSLALRQVVDTTVTMPACRTWDGAFSEESLADGRSEIVREAVQRSLVSVDSYAAAPDTVSQERSRDIWTELLDGASFLDKMD